MMHNNNGEIPETLFKERNFTSVVILTLYGESLQKTTENAINTYCLQKKIFPVILNKW